MGKNLKKIIASSLAVVTVAGALATTSGAAQAKPIFFPHHHHGFVGWGAAGLIGGLALGAVAANAYAGGYDCGRVRQRVYTPDGYFAGYRWVSAC